MADIVDHPAQRGRQSDPHLHRGARGCQQPLDEADPGALAARAVGDLGVELATLGFGPLRLDVLEQPVPPGHRAAPGVHAHHMVTAYAGPPAWG